MLKCSVHSKHRQNSVVKMSDSEKIFKRIVDEVTLKERVENCQVIRKSPSSGKGDGFVGTLETVQLMGTNKHLDLVFKYASTNKKVHEFVPIHDAYLNEIKFYQQIVPAFVQIQKEYNTLLVFDNVPKYYAAEVAPLQEVLVMGDLRVENFKQWDRTKLMDPIHLESTIRLFARFHGCSFVLKKLKPTQWEDLTKDLTTDLFIQFTGTCGLFKTLPYVVKDAIEAFKSPGEEKYRQVLEIFAKDAEEQVYRTRENHEFDVIVHRDCWCNNFMYQYEEESDESTPKNIKMLDFQMVMLGSPAFDLSHFFYSIAPEGSIQNLEHYLKVYIEELRKYLKQYDLDVEEIFPYNSLMAHWKNVTPYSLGINFLLKKVMYLEPENAPDIAEDWDQFFFKLILTPEKQKIYMDEMKSLVKHFVDRGFL